MFIVYLLKTSFDCITIKLDTDTKWSLNLKLTTCHSSEEGECFTELIKLRERLLSFIYFVVENDYLFIIIYSENTSLLQIYK